MNVEILGVDAGNSNIKIIGDQGELSLPSALGEYRERKLQQTFSDNDIEYEFNGKKGFAGTLAKYESQCLASRMGETKAHEEMLVRVLLGISRYSNEKDFKIVVGQPISFHTEQEKAKMKHILHGKHEITVNNQLKEINIHDVAIAAESGSAFWSSPINGLVRIMDIGSGTVNLSTLIDGRYIDKDSFTISEGLETLVANDIESFVRMVSLQALKRWNQHDTVLICGGGAETVLNYVGKHFSKAQLMQPLAHFTDDEDIIQTKTLPPVYGNAVGYFNIGKNLWSS